MFEDQNSENKVKIDFDSELLNEYVLSNMKADANNIHSWRLEIQLETEDETEFNKEIDKASENDTRNGISIASSTALIDYYRRRTTLSWYFRLGA